VNRVTTAARIHLIGPANLLVPAGVMTAALAISLGIFALLRQNDVGTQDASFAGGLSALYVTVMVLFIQAMNRPFAFALGFGLTRRAYLLGTGLFALGLCAGWGAVLSLLWLLERATGGWGVQMEFFAAAGLDTGGPFTQALAYAVPMLALAATGALFGGIFVRWGQLGVYALAMGLLILVGALVVVLTATHSWTSSWSWITDQPSIAVTAGYPWLVVLVCGGAAFWIARGTEV